MKKILLISALAVIVAGCANSSTPGDIVEGRVTHLEQATVIKTPEKSDITYSVEITYKEDKYTLPVSEGTHEKVSKQNSPQPLYVRMKKDEKGMYALAEVAQLNYDNGTPAVYEFPSDKKVIANYYNQ